MAEWHTRYAKDVVEKSMQVQVLSRPPSRKFAGVVQW